MKEFKLEPLHPHRDKFEGIQDDFIQPKNTHRIEYSIESRVYKWYLDENGDVIDYEEGMDGMGNAVTDDYSLIKRLWNEIYCNLSGQSVLQNLYEKVIGNKKG